MIQLYFNSNGYYIEGEGVEVARSFSPSVDESGRPLIEPLQHLYVVLACALQEVRGCKRSGSDIIVYNDSRIIEDMNSELDADDCVCGEMKSIIRRRVLPHLAGVVLFRKKPASFIEDKVAYGSQTMLQVADRRCLMRMAETMAASIEENARAGKAQRVASLRRAWFGDQHND